MPRFEPFPGIGYDPAQVRLDDVVAPPYDIIGPDERARLAARSPYNIVHLDLPLEDDGLDRYQAARCLLDQWLADGVLAIDRDPAFYVYKMGFRDHAGVARQTVGVIGALELVTPGEGGILPHERTMSRPKGDRLNLLRACRANLSPIWGLSLAPGLSALCDVSGPPMARCTDDGGVHHRLWRLTPAASMAAVAETVGSAPIIIADGHHRYETALVWQEEVRAASGGRSGSHDLVLAYVVELATDQLQVGPIHRMISGLPDGFDAVDSLAAHIDLVPGGVADQELDHRMAADGGFAVVAPGGVWWGGARAPSADAEPDAAVLDGITVSWPAHTVEYTHRSAEVVSAVAKAHCDLGLVLRPATVDQIARTAHTGRRLPPKTTFFQPKPRTGMILRLLDDPAPRPA